MSLQIGIVGLPNVGKSTLFQALTKKQVDRSNYPFCTIDPNVGVVKVPDERIEKLAEIAKSAKKIYATVEFVDIAGLVKGASKGEGLGNKFLANIREVDLICYVLRCFENDDITRDSSSSDALSDKEVLDAEMALKDLDTLDKRIQGLEREAKSGDKDKIFELEVIKKAKEVVERDQVLYKENWDKDEKKVLKQYEFLTLKPRIYLLNGNRDEVSESLVKEFDKNNWPYLVINILEEFDAIGLTVDERKELELPEKLEMDNLIKKAYEKLGLITFLTTGEDETRAWTTGKGSSAPQASGVIHTDFEKYFISADIISYEDLVEAEGLVSARDKGLIRTEGKGYVVEDGDVIEVRSGK
ncbi:MAG: redox-regulated ATPase YchF [Parcubacteria group bacterium]|nr:redox-regulated ATPase YchF [Parcubacteria group bacterium]